MAIRYFDGFDTYKTFAEVQNSPGSMIAGSNNHNISTSGGRFGGGCVAMYSSNTLTFNFGAAQNSVVFFGCSFRGLSWNVSDTEFMRIFSSSGSYLGRLYFNLTGQISIANASNTIVARSAPGCFQSSDWFRLELRFVPGSTSGNGSMIVRINGKEAVSATGINTRNGSDTLAAFIVYGPSAASESARLDDVVIWDDQGPKNNDWLGDLRIDTLVPTSNSSDQDWTPNTGSAWDAVNDAPSAADDDTTYIASSIVGQKSNFAIGPLSGNSAAVRAVQVRARAKKTDVGATTLKTYVSSGSANAEDVASITPTTSYMSLRGEVLEADPDVSDAWDDASVNAMKVGVKLAS